jgi:maleate isomerase
MDTNRETAGASARSEGLRTVPVGGVEAPAIRHGWRLRLGMLIPSVNTEAEPQIEAMLPAGVSLHTTRLKMVESQTPRELLGMADRVEEGAMLLADAGVDRILFNCTAVTTFEPGLADRIRDRITQATGLPAIATADAVVAALRALGARKIVMVTPYLQEVNDRETAFLARHGITVLKERGSGLCYAKDFRAIEPYAWYRAAMDMRDEEADAYFISCAQLRIAEMIGAMENDLGRPVITSNQASVWHCLRESGLQDRVTGYGTLLQQ